MREYFAMFQAKPNELLTVWAVTVIILLFSGLSRAQDSAPENQQEFYEIRIYQIDDFQKQKVAEEYLENALMPALGRLGLDRIGVFTNLTDDNDHSLYMVIPYPSLETFANLNASLASDVEFQKLAQPYVNRALKNPVYSRIESRFLKAFSGMPVMEISDLTKTKSDRIFEMRLYESHTEDHARRKVQMFNEGEMQIMRDVDLGPVFFGETLIGPDVPNLIYLLSAKNQAEHKQHFQAFLKHPEWDRIKVLPQYKDTVSKIRRWFLTPTTFSQL
ncbi:MAG: NIPSNAP family protein [Planctomycetota bacterium]